MSCINKKSKEYLQLLEDSGLPSIVLDAKITAWQNRNGIDVFPSLEELNLKKQIINQEIEQKETFETGTLIEKLKTNETTSVLQSSNNSNDLKIDNLVENKKLLFGDKPIKQTSANDVLKNIIDNSENYNLKELTFYLEKAFNLLTKTGARFHIVSDEEFEKMSENNQSVSMVYNSQNNIIYTSNDRLSKFSYVDIIESFIHEVSHSTTLRAYIEPKTYEEHQFKQFIDDSFEQFKFLSQQVNEEGKQMYGFTNQAEFISEIYSNPKFRQEIEKLEKGWFNELINYIRRLFNLPKTIRNNEFISSAILFEMVEKFAEKDNSNWKGTINYNPLYDLNYNKEIKNAIDLSTFDKRLDNTINKMELSIKENIIKFENYANRFPDNKALNKYVSTLKDLRDNISTYQESNKLKAILLYLKQMNNTLSYIEKKLNNVDKKDFKELEKILKSQEEYINSFSVIENIEKLINEIESDDSSMLNEKEHKELINLTKFNIGKYKTLKSKSLDLKKLFIKNYLLDIKYFPDLEKKHYERLSKEHSVNKVFQEKDSWIRDKFENRDKQLIEEDLKLKVEQLIENPLFDTYSASVTFQSTINMSSPLIQIFNYMLSELDSKRIEEERKKDLEFKKMFDLLVAEKGTTDINKLYKNLYVKTKSGNHILVDEYNVSLYNNIEEIENLSREKYNEIKEIKNNLKDLKEDSTEYKEAIKSIEKIEEKYKDKSEKLKKETFDIVDDKFVPKEKFKTNYTLTETEKKVLEFFKEVSDEGAKKTYYNNPLVKFKYGTKVYEFPKITKSDTERMWSGEVKGIVKDKVQNLTTVRPDDVGYTTVNTDSQGNIAYDIPIRYRNNYNNFDHSMQSLDLMTIYNLEYKNTNAYNHKIKLKNELQYLIDIAENKDYYNVSGSQIVKSSRSKEYDLKKGVDSNTVKVMKNVMESKFYEILRHNGIKLGNTDINKVVDYLNGGTAMLGLTLNVASGTANVLNAQAQLFLESFIKGHYIKASGIKKANLKYSNDLPNILKDLTNGVNTSFTNQMLSYFNVKGDFNFSKTNFLRSTLIKYGFNTESLQVFQNSGEHWIQSTIAMSVLDGVKVLDKDGKFLNKEGKIVEKFQDAASVLDMLAKDKEGLLNLNDKVVYTTHSKFTKWQEGGKEKVESLIIKKIYDSVGNYREMDQPELYRHWLGRLVGFYRRFLVPMGTARLKGIETSLIKKENLTEKDLSFNYALQEYEEGTYTTLVRYIRSSVKGLSTFTQLVDNFKDLNEYEKNNLKKATIEIIITSILGPLAALIAGSADDDDEVLFFVAYQLRRLDTELSAYRSLSENFKMMRSPIPSANLAEHVLWSLDSVINPFSWDNLTEEYDQGPHKRENKFKIKQMKKIPVFRDFVRSYQDYYEFQNKPWGGSFGQ